MNKLDCQLIKLIFMYKSRSYLRELLKKIQNTPPNVDIKLNLFNSGFIICTKDVRNYIISFLIKKLR